MAYCTTYTEKENYFAKLDGLSTSELNELVKRLLTVKGAALYVTYLIYRQNGLGSPMDWHKECVGSSKQGGLASITFKEENGEMYVSRNKGYKWYRLISGYAQISRGDYSRVWVEPGQTEPSFYVTPKEVTLSELLNM